MQHGRIRWDARRGFESSAGFADAPGNEWPLVYRWWNVCTSVGRGVYGCLSSNIRQRWEEEGGGMTNPLNAVAHKPISSSPVFFSCL